MAAPGDPKVQGAKSADGPFTAGDLEVDISHNRRLNVKVTSTEDSPEPWTLHEGMCCAAAEGHYDISWFKGDEDISHDVQTSGHEFTLNPDKPRRFLIRVKPQVNDPHKACLWPEVDQGAPPVDGVHFALKHLRACAEL